MLSDRVYVLLEYHSKRNYLSVNKFTPDLSTLCYLLFIILDLIFEYYKNSLLHSTPASSLNHSVA